MAKKDSGDDARSPWLVGVTGVKGVVPPGRRLSPPAERRERKWSASGVRGVTPPGKQKPGEGPAAESAEKAERRRALRDKENKHALEAARATPRALAAGRGRAPAALSRETVDPGRPMAGFKPDPFVGLRDPDDLKGFLEQLSEFTKTITPSEHAGESLAELIMQSHAPYEVAVAFTLLSVIVGKSTQLRRKHTAPLERGAKTFFNLAMRLNPNVKAPRGLVPETMDAIFYDLPATAYQAPYAFATDAFARMVSLLRNDVDTDRELIRFTLELRNRFIEQRSLGDKPLGALFPFELPDWAPEQDEPGDYGG